MHSGMRGLIVALKQIQPLLADVLRGGGIHRLVAVASSAEALDRCAYGGFSFALIDARLGAEDGVELLRTLRASPDHPARRMPTVVLCDGTLDQVEAARAAGADALVIKPVRPQVLLSHLRRLFAAPADDRAWI